jgi:hypothetical protein
MNTHLLPLRTLAAVLIASPFMIMGAYIAILMIPIIVREVACQVVNNVVGQ